jgi:GT2 family glycosyltransferase
MDRLVSAIVVNWNGLDLLESCFYSIFSQTYTNLEVIMVDCASRDDSLRFVERNYPAVRLIALEEDRGPAHAINLGAREARGDYVLILNNDVILPQEMLSTLMEKMSDEQVCVINPVEVSWGGEYLGSGCYSGWIGRFLYRLVRLRGSMPFYPSTACCLTPKDVVTDNPLNENLFMYEDTEWGWRLHLKQIAIKVADDVHFLHRGSGSEDTPYSPKQAFFVGRAVTATCFICFKVPTMIVMLPVLACNYLWQVLIYARRKKFRSIIAYTKGHFAFFAKLRDFMEDHRKSQKERTIGDLQILKIMIGSIDFARRATREWSEAKRPGMRRITAEAQVVG